MLDTSRQWGKSVSQIGLDHRNRYYFASNRAKGRTLDAACGVGYGSYILADVVPLVVGVDIEPEAIEWAQRYFAGPTYLVGTLEDMPWEGEFDTVIAFEIIEHIESPRNTLRVLREACKGTFIASTPNQEVYPFSKERFAKDKYPHYRHYTPLEFDALLEGAGFVVEDRYCQDKKDGQIRDGVEGQFLIYVCT